MRYWAIWLASTLLEISGAITVALTFVACVLVLQFRDQPLGIPLDTFSFYVDVLVSVGFEQVLVTGLSSALGLFVIGQLLAILLSMEKNSRLTRELLSQELYKLVMEEAIREREVK
jgi:hypothetical protein